MIKSVDPCHISEKIYVFIAQLGKTGQEIQERPYCYFFEVHSYSFFEKEGQFAILGTEATVASYVLGYEDIRVNHQMDVKSKTFLFTKECFLHTQ